MVKVAIDRFLTADEERKLIRRGQRGDHDARNRVIMNIYPLIVRHVGRHRILRNDQEDAVNFVIGVLAEKFYKFSLKYKVRYHTYAMHWVEQAIRRFMMRMALIDIPYALQTSCHDPKKVKWYQRYGYLAERAKVVHGITPDAEGSQELWSRQFVSSEPDPSASSESLEDLEQARRLLGCIDAREREILLRRCQGERLWEIGEQMGLTRERVRQIEKRATERLRELAGVDSVA